MGYDTQFQGNFKLDKPLKLEHAEYLKAFNETRHMRLYKHITETFIDPVRLAVGLPIGEQGCYYVGTSERDGGVIDYNKPASSQPGLYCQWTYNEKDNTIEWDGGEKFYNYVEWIEYLITHFLGPWGYNLNGEVRWRGEEFDDVGKIVIKDNAVSIQSF